MRRRMRETLVAKSLFQCTAVHGPKPGRNRFQTEPQPLPTRAATAPKLSRVREGAVHL